MTKMKFSTAAQQIRAAASNNPELIEAVDTLENAFRSDVYTQDFVYINERRYTFSEAVIRASVIVQKYLGISLPIIRSLNKKEDIAAARHILCYLLRELTFDELGNKITFERIGRVLDRYHATIIHSAKKAENILNSKDIYSVRYREIIAKYKNDIVKTVEK